MGIEAPTTEQPLHSFYDVTHPGEFSIIGTDTDSREHILRVPEAGVVLTQTDNVRLAETTVVDGEIAVRIPIDSVLLLNLSLDPKAASDEVRRQDHVYQFQRYINDFLEANKDFAEQLKDMALTPRAVFATDPLSNDKIICILPSK
jgi:hypothetical protein